MRKQYIRCFKDWKHFLLVRLTPEPLDVAHVVLNAVNLPSSELKIPCGKRRRIIKARTELSDRDLEKWVRESYVEKKGFVRQ